MTVQITIGQRFGGPQPVPGALVVDDERGCLAYLPDIERAAADATRCLTVVVRNPAAAAMLAYLRERPGVEVREADVCTDLADRWGCRLPPNVSPALIEALRLLDAPPPPGGDVVGAILRRAYGEDVFLSPALEAAAEGRLLGALVRGHPYSAAVAAIEQLLRERLRAWQQRGSWLAGALAEAPGIAAWCLIAAVLRRYPDEVRRAVRSSLVPTFGPPPANDPPVAETAVEPVDVPPAVRTYLEAALRPHLAVLPLGTYLANVSGVLPAELDVLARRVEDCPGSVDLKSARAAFGKVEEGRAEPALERLERRWRAAEALDFDVGASVRSIRAPDAFEALAAFYTGRYLAVKSVYGADAAARSRLIAWNEDYAAWLVENYHRLAAASEPVLAASRLHHRLKELLQGGRVPIVLAVDGLAWEAFVRLRRAAERAGLWLYGEPRACLAPLPTITEIGMTALVAGAPPAAVAQEWPDRTAWRAARDTAFGRQYPGARIRKANNPTQVRDALAVPAPAYLLYATSPDKQVHDPDVDQELLARWQDLYFETVWRALVEAGDMPHLRERLDDLVVVVVTDHGYTDLLRQEAAALPEVLKGQPSWMAVEAPHHAALEVSLPAAETTTGAALRRLLAENWFVVEGEGFGLPAGPCWILPRRQQRVRGGAPRLHGRASLEETIVPMAEFVFRRPWVAELAVALAGRMTKGERSAVHLSVTNLSTWPVRDVVVDVPELGIATRIERIEAERTETVPVEARPRRSGQQTARVQIRASGAPRQVCELKVVVERSEEERLVGDDRVGRLFDEEDW